MITSLSVKGEPAHDESSSRIIRRMTAEVPGGPSIRSTLNGSSGPVDSETAMEELWVGERRSLQLREMSRQPAGSAIGRESHCPIAGLLVITDRVPVITPAEVLVKSPPGSLARLLNQAAGRDGGERVSKPSEKGSRAI